MHKSKLGVWFMSFMLLLSALTISFGEVSAETLSDLKANSEHFEKVVGMDEKTFNEKMDELIALLEEMDAKGIDIVNMENNSPRQLAFLSQEAKDLYYSYKDELDKGVDEISGEFIVEEAAQSTDEVSTAQKVRGIYISNATVSKINKASGLSGGVFGVGAALIKMKLGLSPTALTALILAVSALGVAGINACNWHDKGFYITAEFYGSITAPVGTVACVPKK